MIPPEDLVIAANESSKARETETTPSAGEGLREDDKQMTAGGGITESTGETKAEKSEPGVIEEEISDWVVWVGGCGFL